MLRISRPGSYLFTGRAYDAETALYYYRARYYDYYTGRFLQPDPIRYGDGLNVYAYVADNSTNLVDPYGLWKVNQWSGHQQLTSLAMQNMGFSTQDAGIAVTGSISTDFRPDHYPGGNDAPHFTPGMESQAAAHAAGALELAVQYELQGRHDLAMYMLGAGMHTIQDRHSHSELGAGWKKHLFGPTDPDNPTKHIREYINALKDSKKYIAAFQRAVAKKNADIDSSGGIGNGYVDIPDPPVNSYPNGIHPGSHGRMY